MVLAWLVILPTGIFSAVYLRQFMAGQKLLGKDAWFIVRFLTHAPASTPPPSFTAPSTRSACYSSRSLSVAC